MHSTIKGANVAMSVEHCPPPSSTDMFMLICISILETDWLARNKDQ